MSYAAAIATAKRLLGRKGTVVTVTRTTQGAINPISGVRAAGGDLSGKYYTVGLPPGRDAERQIGSLINRKLKMFYMAKASTGIDAQPGDIVPWGGLKWTLIWTATYDPDDSGAIFTQAYAEIA